jgi:hypothetical protein
MTYRTRGQSGSNTETSVTASKSTFLQSPTLTSFSLRLKSRGPLYGIINPSDFGIATLVSPAARRGLSIPFCVLIPFRKVAVPRASKSIFPILLFLSCISFFIPNLRFLRAARPDASPSLPFGSQSSATDGTAGGLLVLTACGCISPGWKIRSSHHSFSG